MVTASVQLDPSFVAGSSPAAPDASFGGGLAFLLLIVLLGGPPRGGVA